MGRFPLRLPRWEFIWREGGQSLVLVALSFSLLCAGGAMGIDIGRFYAERRFLQDAVDAAALACARSFAISSSSATAWSAADDILQNRLLHKNPLGLTVTYAARGSETYDNNIVADVNLNSGILPISNSNGRGCRVAVTVAVPTYLIKIVSPALNTISQTTRAYAKAKGGLLPSVIKRYLNLADTDDDPNNDGANEFVDTTAREGFDSACHAGSNYLPSCQAATLGQPGREFVLFGASQKGSDNDFRGYIGLDVRNFSDANPPDSANLQHDSYNGVAPDASINTLKDFEASWITEGYPGPDICVVDTVNFLKCAQVATISGASSGIMVDEYNQFFHIGDIGLFQLYDGNVKTVPDFTMVVPSLANANNGTVPSVTVQYQKSAQFAVSNSQICTQIIPDNGTVTLGPGDTTGFNPFLNGHITGLSVDPDCSGTGTGNFSQNPTPNDHLATYNQTWQNMAESNVSADQGIYQVFLHATASAPYNSRVHDFLVTFNVGSQSHEFYLDSSDAVTTTSMDSLPGTVTWNINVNSSKAGSTKWSNGQEHAVTVSWESCPRSDDVVPVVLTCYIGTPGTTSTSVSPTNNVTVTSLTSGVARQKSYTGWIRATGTDRTNHPVTKLWQVRLDVDQGTTTGTTNYVDVIGYAAYQITNIDSNDVYGRSVTGTYLDPNDPALAIAKKIVLVPWETP